MLETLEKYYQNGLVSKQTHPRHDLIIWNYTPKVQYDRLWDDITLQCRGLVTNSKGVIVARPFKKFFNYTFCFYNPFFDWFNYEFIKMIIPIIGNVE